MAKKRLLSGIRPTGSLHIGHYLGVLHNWEKLQHEHECFYFIADWHTLTTKYKDTGELQSDIIEVAKDIIASGVDPNKATLYVQSAVPEVAELHLLLSMVTYQNWVERDPTLKDMIEVLIHQSSGSYNPEEQIGDKLEDLKSLRGRYSTSKKNFYMMIGFLKAFHKGKEPQKIPREIYEHLQDFEEEIDSLGSSIERLIKIKEQYEKTKRKIEEEVTYGLLGYPVLMTADILSVLGEYVPVGRDQVAHLELTRDIARRFNFIYKTNLFPEPEPLLTETPSVPGIDGRKMSKSLNNDIKLVDNNEITKKKVLQMITDPKKIKLSDPGEPNDCQVAYKHYEIFADKKTLTTVQEECRGAKIGCVDCKKRLATIVNDSFSSIRAKRESLKNDKEIIEILNIGNKKARQVTKQTLEKVREVMKLRTWDKMSF